MARTTNVRKQKATANQKEPVRKILCTGCDREKKISDFYKSYNPSHKTGILPHCKECMAKNIIDDSGMLDKDLFVEMLQTVDRPFIHAIYEATLEEGSETHNQFLGLYVKNIALPQYRTFGFKDSMFLREELEEEAPKKQKIMSKKDRYKLTMSERNDLIDKWGNFSDEHLFRFEKTYQQMAKGYQIHTTLHQEALVTYSKYKVLQDLAIESGSGNLQEAKIYGDLATKARTDAKLNPSQLTKNDIQVGGVDSFSQIAELVAKRDGLINIPMQYLKKPQDILDWQMLENVNYMRSSLNMPEIEYEEMHKLYFDRIEKFNERYDADIMSNDFGTWND